MGFVLGLLAGLALDWRKVWAWISSLLSDDVPTPRPKPTLRIRVGEVREQQEQSDDPS